MLIACPLVRAVLRSRRERRSNFVAASLVRRSAACVLLAGLDLRDRAPHQVDHDAPDFLVRHLDALGVEILADLGEDVVVLDLGDDDLLGIGGGVGSGEAELFGGPQAQQAVAARRRLELEIFVVSELLLEAFFALVECGHGGGSRVIIYPAGRVGDDWRLAYRVGAGKATPPKPRKRWLR